MDKELSKGLSEVLDKSAIKNSIDLFIKEDLDKTRFLLLLEIRHDGCCYYRESGSVTGLELVGLPELVSYITDLITEDREKQKAEEQDG